MQTKTVEILGTAVLEAYIQKPSKEMPNQVRRRAILVLPGGGYHMCSDREAEPVALAYMASGFNAFVLRYSVGEDIGFERVLAEAEEALKYIRENADDLNIMADRVAVIGFSAGGHLASALAAMGCVRPDAAILGYPCILSSIGKVLAFPVPSTNEYVDDKTPPTFIFSTANDGCVPIANSLAFADECAEHGVNFELHIFSNGSHGLSLATSATCAGDISKIEYVSSWLGMSIQWLDRIWA